MAMKLINRLFCLRILFFVTICFLYTTSFYAQNPGVKDTSQVVNPAKKAVVKTPENIQNILMVEEKNGLLLRKENKVNREQNELFDAIYKNIQEANFVLKTGIDYKGFTSELASVVSLKKTAIDGVIKNKTDFQTFRNITVTSILLKELQTRIDFQMDNIQKNRTQLSAIQSKIDSLTSKKVLFILPKDSTTKFLYYDKYKEMSTEVNLLDKRFKDALDSIGKLQIKGNRFKYELQNDIVETDNIRKEEFSSLFSPDGNIFKESVSKDPLGFSFFGSLVKEFIILMYFISNHYDIISVMFLSLFVLIFYILILKRKYKKEGLYDRTNSPKRIFNHPVASSILISFTLLNFFFLSPPFAFTSIMWLISIIALTIINKEYFTTKEKRVWRIYAVFIILGLHDNNILEHSIGEVYFILFIAIAIVAFSFYTLKRNSEILNPLFKHTIIALIILEITAVGFILLGDNYNLGKLLMVNGVILILLYYLFVNAFCLLIEIINYSMYLNESKEERLLDINELETVNLTFVNRTLFVIAGIVTICKNSYFFQTITDPIVSFFTEQRKIGDIDYSFGTILLFFSIIMLSVIIAKVVSFLTSSTITSSSNNKTNKFGSWMLLIQITIFTIGISFAFITCGIPMDRLTIIISALGVGIGFGLQTLVNNLVSGLIIAFEKPVNLQDVIEISGKMVRMKSIGIRSSVVTTFDGADIIIPNGDLLSQQLTNWTLSNNRKRTDIVVGVAYGTDLEKAKMLMAEILKNNPLVLQYPEPIVWVTDFNSSSIDIVVKYWVRSLDEANEVKSQLIIAIDTVFRANNIEIPFPQSDIHVKSINGDKNN